MTPSNTPSTACETLATKASVLALRGPLAQLAEAPDGASSIVQHPDWLLFELESRGAKASPHLMVARDQEGRIMGYASLLREHRRARVRIGKHAITLYRGSMLRMLGEQVIARQKDRRSVEKIIATALASDRSVRVIHIQESLLPNTLATTLTCAHPHFKTLHFNLLEQLNWTIQSPSSAQDYLAGMDSKRRNDLTRRLRKVYKKLGDEAYLRTFDAPEHIDEYCRLMNQVYAHTWHADEQPIDWELTSRRTLLTQLARRKQFIGHMLMLGPRPIAYVHGYRIASRYLLDDTGYDNEFAALGVGSALVFQAVQDLLDRYPGETIDFGYGDNQYKQVLANHKVACGSLYLVRGLNARLCMGLITPLRKLYQHLHKVRK